jgi:pyruvate kinase
MIEQHSRRTKIVNSFEGKALLAQDASEVRNQDVDVFRLVYEAPLIGPIQGFIKALRAKGQKGENSTVMLDLASWTQAVVSNLAAPREVSFGERLTVSSAELPSTIRLKSAGWDRLFKADAKVFIGSGNVVLRTIRCSKDQAELEVTQGGVIYPEMDVTIPDTRRDPERFKIDVAELKGLIEEGVDYLIVSGQWTLPYLLDFRRKLAAQHGDNTPWLLVKVDSGEVYERLPELLAHLEGVVISRREMALTINPVTVPMITKEIIQRCNDHAKIVLTASEMLASMRHNVTPTRAEVSDVANAVIDGTDAVLLSEEVANGRFGTKAVEVMARIITDIEGANINVQPNWIKHTPTVANEMDAIAYHALRTAERIGARAIVTITKAGNTPLKLASFRAPVPIIAVTFSAAVKRRLAMVRGVQTLLLDIDPNIDQVLPIVNDQLVRDSWLKAGDAVIFVAITLSPVGKEASNLFTIQNLS